MWGRKFKIGIFKVFQGQLQESKIANFQLPIGERFGQSVMMAYTATATYGTIK